MRCRLGLLVALTSLLPAGSTAETGDYENAPPLRASELLPAELRQGPHHVVEDQVVSDGFVRSYTIRSEFGRFEARGDDVLRVRIREIEAIAVLRAAQESEAYRAAAERAGESPFASGWELGSQPSGVLGRLPGGGGGGLPGLPGLPGREPQGQRESQGGQERPGGFLADLVGFQAKQREVALALGVDPHTTNAVLRRELDAYGWVAHAGGAPIDFASDGTGAPASARVRDYSADDLDRLNRIELAVMGVPEPLREEFLDNPAFSPSESTVLVESLAALEGTEDRAAFIEAAVGAQSEQEARSYQRMAEIMRQFGESEGGLQRIVNVDGQLAARAADGTLIVPVRSDHAVWTKQVEGFAESMARAAGRDPEVMKARIVFSGTLSPTARQRMEGLGLAVTEEGLAPSETAPAPEPLPEGSAPEPERLDEAR